MNEVMKKYGIPEHMHGGLERYIVQHIEPGGFLRAILESNIEEAATRADNYNLKCIGNYFEYLSDCAPQVCWGSAEKVEAWLKMRNEEQA